MNETSYEMICTKLNVFTEYARAHGYESMFDVIVNIDYFPELHDQLSSFNELVRLFGYDGLDDKLLLDLKEYESSIHHEHQ